MFLHLLFCMCVLQVEKALAIPPSMQKLMYKGLLKNDTDTLEKVRYGAGRRVGSVHLHAISLAVGAVAGAGASG